jgi:hypothetical protein
MLKSSREKCHVSYKVKSVRIYITADFSTESLNARKAWNNVFKC